MVGWTDGYTTRHYQPLKTPLTHKQAQKTHICMQSSKHTYEQRMLEEAGEQASRPVHAVRRKVRQANRQAGRLEYVRCCAAAQTKKTYSSSPQQKKLTTNPLPLTETLKQKKHNHCTHAQHTTRHETTTKEASSTTLYSTRNRDDDDGRRWWWWVYAMCNFKYGGGVNKVREKQFSSLW